MRTSFLVHYPACADVHMAYLAVAHLPIGQTHSQASCIQGGIDVLGLKAIEIGLSGLNDCGDFGVWRNSPSIQYNEHYPFLAWGKVI